MRAALLLAALLVAGTAHGQSALEKHDTNGPIDIDAAKIDVQDKAGQALFSGDVRMKQGDLNLAANTVKVFYRKKGDAPEIVRLDASGGVNLVSPSERATGDYGIYDVEHRLLTMTGHVVLNQNQSVLRGSRLVIDLENGRSSLDSRVTGGGASGVGQTSSGGRVSGRFVVPERKAQ